MQPCLLFVIPHVAYRLFCLSRLAQVISSGYLLLAGRPCGERPRAVSCLAMSSGSTQSKQLSWVELLRNIYGDRVEDCFADTAMHEHAQKLGAGLWLVRFAVEADMLKTCNAQLHDCFEDIIKEKGPRAIALQGKKRWYDTIQCVAGICICKYVYEGTARRKTYALKDLPSHNHLTEWLHSQMQVPNEKQFNEIVSNRYLQSKDESIPWHSDVAKNRLLAQDAEVLSLTLGSPGAFCWHFDEKGDFSLKAKQKSIDRKERGVLFLLPGDLLLTDGSFQKNFRHKTLPYSRLPDPDLANKYTGSNPAMLGRFDCMQSENKEHDRIAVTWRRIVNHDPGCPELPARLSPLATPPPLPPAQSPVAPAPFSEAPAPAIPTLVNDPLEIQPTHMLKTVKSALAFIEWVNTVADNMEGYLETCPVESRAALTEGFDKLCIRNREVLRTKALGELSVDVHSRLQELSRYGGSKKAFDTMQPPSDSKPFEKGACGSGTSTICRVVVSLRVAEILFKNADVDRYISHEAVVCVPARMLAGHAVYWLQGGVYKKRKVADFDPEWAQFRVFELPLNYESTMQRFSLNPLPKQEDKPRDVIIRRYLAAWWDLLLQEKRRHHPPLEYCFCFGHLNHNEGNFGEHDFQNHIQSVRDYLWKKGGF